MGIRRLKAEQRKIVRDAGYDPTQYRLLYDVPDRLILCPKDKPEERLHIKKPVPGK